MKASIAMVSLLIIANIASAQPPGPPPTFSVVAGTQPEKGTITMTVTVAVFVPYAVQEKIVANGKEVIVTKYVEKTEFKQEVVTYDATQSRVITPDGKQLPIDEVWKRLKKNSVVAVSADGNTPAPAYLRALSAETLVIILGRPKGIEIPAPKKLP